MAILGESGSRSKRRKRRKKKPAAVVPSSGASTRATSIAQRQRTEEKSTGRASRKRERMAIRTRQVAAREKTSLPPARYDPFNELLTPADRADMNPGETATAYFRRVMDEERARRDRDTFGADIEAAAAVDVPSREGFGNLWGDVEEVPQQIGPALANIGYALSEEARGEGPSGLEIIRGERSITDTPLYERVIGPTIEQVRYDLSRSPVIVRYDENGEPIYRATNGGETRDPTKAKRSIGAKLHEHPLPYLLYGAAVPSVAGGTAGTVARSGLAGERAMRFAQPRPMYLETEAGNLIRTGSTSRNLWTREMQKGIRWATTRIPNRIGDRTVFMGEHARAARAAARQQRRGERAEISAEVREFDKTLAKLKGREKVAVVLRAQAVRPSELIGFVNDARGDAIARLETLGSKAKKTKPERQEMRRLRQEIGDHNAMQQLLERTSDELYDSIDTDPKLKAALEEGRRVNETAGDILEELGQLDPLARQLRPYLTARAVRAARNRPENDLAYAEERLAVLDQAYEKTIEPLAKHFMEGSKADVARVNLINQRRKRGTRKKKPHMLYSEKARRTAEEHIARMIETMPDDPTVQKFAALMAERDKLRAQVGEAQMRALGPDPDAPDGEAIPEPDFGREPVAAAVQRELDKTNVPEDPELERAAVEAEVARAREIFGDAFFTSHAAGQMRTGQYPLRRSGARPVRKLYLTRQNRALRLLTSRWLPSPSVWRDTLIKTLAYAHAVARGRLAWDRFGRALNEDGSLDKDGYAIVNPDAWLSKKKQKRGALSIPLSVRERQGLRDNMDLLLDPDTSPDNIMHGLSENVVTDNTAQIARWEAEVGRENIRQISKYEYDQLFGEFKPASDFVRRFLDRPTDFWRKLTLNLRPAWFVNNFVGQHLLYALNNFSPTGAAGYSQAVYNQFRRKENREETPHELTGLYEQEQSQAGGIVAASGRGFNKGVELLARFNAKVTDTLPREAAWFAKTEQRRRMFNRMNGTAYKAEEFRKALVDAGRGRTDERLLRELHDDLVQEILDELIDFGDMSNLERSYIRRVLPFYSWLKGITKATALLGFRHPGRLALMVTLARSTEREFNDWFDGGYDVLRNALGLRKEDDLATVLQTNGLNPFQTISDNAKFIKGLLYDFEPGFGSENPANSFGPMWTTVLTGIFGKDLFTGQPVTGPGVVGRSARAYLGEFPQYQTVDRTLNPQTETGRGEPKLTQPILATVFGRQVDVSPVLRYFGLPLTRKNLTAAKRVIEQNAADEMEPKERLGFQADKKYRELVSLEEQRAKKFYPGGVLPEEVRRQLKQRYEVELAINQWKLDDPVWSGNKPVSSLPRNEQVDAYKARLRTQVTAMRDAGAIQDRDLRQMLDDTDQIRSVSEYEAIKRNIESYVWDPWYDWDRYMDEEENF